LTDPLSYSKGKEKTAEVGMGEAERRPRKEKRTNLGC
jgi:hypothetical protein